MSKPGKKIEFISLSCGDPEPSRKSRESSMKSTSSAPPAKKSRADIKEQEGHDSLDRSRSASPHDGVNYKRIQAMFDQLREDLTYTMNTRLRALETEMQDLKKTLESCRKENQTLRKEVGKSLPKSQNNDDILLLPISPQVMDRLEQAPEDDPLYITYVKYIKDMTEIYHHTQLSTVFSEETLFHYNWAGRFQKRAISRSRVFGVIKALWFRNEVAKMKPFISSELDKSRNRLMMRKMRKQQGVVPPRQTREAIDEREEEEEGSEEEVEDKSRVQQEIEDFEDPLNYRH